MGRDEIGLPGLIEGFDAAFARFQTAASERDAQSAFEPLFEALAWAYSIDEWLKEHGLRRDLAELRGLRWARRRVHHRWERALYVADVAHVVDARRGISRIKNPLRFEWRWRPELARARRGNGDRTAYRDHLSGQPARHTLASVAEFLHASPPARDDATN